MFSKWCPHTRSTPTTSIPHLPLGIFPQGQHKDLIATRGSGLPREQRGPKRKLPCVQNFSAN